MAAPKPRMAAELVFHSGTKAKIVRHDPTIPLFPEYVMVRGVGTPGELHMTLGYKANAERYTNALKVLELEADVDEVEEFRDEACCINPELSWREMVAFMQAHPPSPLPVVIPYVDRCKRVYGRLRTTLNVAILTISNGVAVAYKLLPPSNQMGPHYAGQEEQIEGMKERAYAVFAQDLEDYGGENARPVIELASEELETSGNLKKEAASKKIVSLLGAHGELLLRDVYGSVKASYVEVYLSPIWLGAKDAFIANLEEAGQLGMRPRASGSLETSNGALPDDLLDAYRALFVRLLMLYTVARLAIKAGIDTAQPRVTGLGLNLLDSADHFLPAANIICPAESVRLPNAVDMRRDASAHQAMAATCAAGQQMVERQAQLEASQQELHMQVRSLATHVDANTQAIEETSGVVDSMGMQVDANELRVAAGENADAATLRELERVAAKQRELTRRLRTVQEAYDELKCNADKRAAAAKKPDWLELLRGVQELCLQSKETDSQAAPAAGGKGSGKSGPAAPLAGDAAANKPATRGRNNKVNGTSKQQRREWH